MEAAGDHRAGDGSGVHDQLLWRFVDHRFALAQTGTLFPLLSLVIGWTSVYMTGLVVNSNTLFAHLQAVTATQIGTSDALLVAANTAGGVMAKLVSPQSIAIAAAAVRLVGQESAIMRSTPAASLCLLAYVCLCTLLLSAVFCRWSNSRCAG